MKRKHGIVIWGVFFTLLGGAGASVTSKWHETHDEAPGLRIVLNIPANRLDVFDGNQRVRTYDVSVGKRPYLTPAGKYRISTVTWNPWWHPPDSEWAAGRKPTPPGPTNPMGRVKLNFAPLLYIHGTTEEDRLGAPASHGCVRMSNSELFELTRMVHAASGTAVRESVLDALEANPKQTRLFRLRRPIPLEVVYDLVEIRDGELVIHPDVYRSGDDESVRNQVLEALKKAGIDTAALSREELDRITMKRNATRLTVPLDALATATEGESEQ